MKKVTVTVETGFVGAQHIETFEVEDDSTDDEISAEAEETALLHFDWSYEVEEV